MKISGVAIGLAGLLAAGSAHAGLLPGNAIYSSFTTGAPDTNGGANSTYSVSTGAASHAGSPLAQEFNVTSPVSLSSLDLRLSDTTAATDGGSILVYLVPNNPATTLPTNNGSLQLTGATLLGTILDSLLPTPSTLGCTFGAGATINACNTVLAVNDYISTPGEYWIALVNGSDTNNGGTNPNSSNAVWWRAGDNLGLNATGQDNAHVNASGVLTAQNPTNITQSFEMQVNTPEPASLALFGAALTGLGFARRRRARKSAGQSCRPASHPGWLLIPVGFSSLAGHAMTSQPEHRSRSGWCHRLTSAGIACSWPARQRCLCGSTRPPARRWQSRFATACRPEAFVPNSSSTRSATFP
jgi:hypothetical protein